jgi:hypothetical protein
MPCILSTLISANCPIREQIKASYVMQTVGQQRNTCLKISLKKIATASRI